MKEMNVKCLRHIKLSQFEDKIIIVLTKRAFIILHWFYFFPLYFWALHFLEKVKYGMARTNRLFCNDSFQSQRNDAITTTTTTT